MSEQRGSADDSSDLAAEELVAAWLADKGYEKNTLATYTVHLRSLLAWCGEERVDFRSLSPLTAQRFKSAGVKAGLKATTVSGRLSAANSWYRWLLEAGIVATNPFENIVYYARAHQLREAFTIDELRLLTEAAVAPKDALLLGFLTVNCLRLTDIESLRISHIRREQGFAWLEVRRSSKKSDHLLALVPPRLNEALKSVVGDRQSGPILRSQAGTAMNRYPVNKVLQRLGRRAGIERVSAGRLAVSMRLIAITRGFSFASLVQAIPQIEVRDIKRELDRVRLPTLAHASLRFDHLITGADDSLSLLSQAQLLLRVSDAPPGVVVARAGAMLERHLRMLCRQEGVTGFDENRQDLTSYAGRLIQAGLFSPRHQQELAYVTDRRNDGAHGWFERVSNRDAEALLDDVERYVIDFPLDGQAVRGSKDP